MSGVIDFLNRLNRLGPFSMSLFVCGLIGALVALVGALSPGPDGTHLLFGLEALAIWIILGVFFGGIAWAVSTLSMWRRSLGKRVVPERDSAVEALRERYARGEIDRDQFDSTLQRLRQS